MKTEITSIKRSCKINVSNVSKICLSDLSSLVFLHVFLSMGLTVFCFLICKIHLPYYHSVHPPVCLCVDLCFKSICLLVTTSTSLCTTCLNTYIFQLLVYLVACLPPYYHYYQYIYIYCPITKHDR